MILSFLILEGPRLLPIIMLRTGGVSMRKQKNPQPI